MPLVNFVEAKCPRCHADHNEFLDNYLPSPKEICIKCPRRKGCEARIKLEGGNHVWKEKS